MLPIFYVEHTKNVLDILLYPESSMGSSWLAPGKIFKMKVLRGLENAILRLLFANTVNASFNRMLIKLYTIIYPSTLQKLPHLENVLTHFDLNFLKSRKLGGEGGTHPQPPVASSRSLRPGRYVPVATSLAQSWSSVKHHGINWSVLMGMVLKICF